MKNTTRNMQVMKKQKGASILEVVIFIAIAAIIGVIAMQFGNTATDSQKINATIQNVSLLKNNIRNTFQTQRTYTGLTNEVLTASSNFPSGMRVAGDNTLIAHGWKADGIDVIAANVDGTADDGFQITLKGLRKEVCNDILDKTFALYAEVEANGTDVTSGIAAIRTNCADGDVNEIVYRDR